MKIQFYTADRPFFTSFQMFKPLDIEKLKEVKRVRITARQESKTRVSTSLNFDNTSLSLNNYVDGYKFDEKAFFSYADYRQHKNYFFKVSKKQSYSEYLKYLERLLTNAFEGVLDSLDVDFVDDFKMWK